MENNDNDDDRPKPQIMFSAGFIDGWQGTDVELIQMIEDIIKLAESTAIVESRVKSLASSVSIDNYAQELSADYVPKK
jgi:hypothetical protein